MNNKFSISLGLLDYVNPIIYSITITTIIKKIYHVLHFPLGIILIIGAIVSILFGLIIPTGKVMVGLGIIKFRMPIVLVFSVNIGILLSGLVLLQYVFNITISVLMVIGVIITILLFLIYIKTKKINTIAVLTGAFGYNMLYISLITLSINKQLILPVVLYFLAIIIFIMLCVIGIKANLKKPKVHWIIEISNVICQFLVVFGTFIVFK